MMINPLAAIALLASVSVFPALAADDMQAARAKYAELAAKIRAGDTGVDWKVLRVAAAIGEVGSDDQPFQKIKDSYSALEEGKFQDALKISHVVEEPNLADVDAHYVAWRSLVGLGRQDQAEKERILLADLLDSITRSGDSKGVNTAWFAATIREEYLLMRSVLNVQFQQQRTWRQDGHYYDVAAVKDKDGKDLILWFNADTEMKRQIAAGDRAVHK